MKMLLKGKFSIGDKKFMDGIYNNLYCEVGLLTDNRELNINGYTRQLCRFEKQLLKNSFFRKITKQPEQFLLSNSNVVGWEETYNKWGTIDGILLSCNGGIVYSKLEKPTTINLATIVFFKEHTINIILE
jgi:hypothetical protein